MKSYLILVPPATKNKQALIWLFRTALLALNIKQVKVDETELPGYETLIYGNNNSLSSLSEADLNIEHIKKAPFDFNNEGLIPNKDGAGDELFTAFYLINCLQEYTEGNRDQIGRFKYENSYQQKSGKIEINFAADLLEQYFKRNFPEVLHNQVNEKSRFFFSHDIDSLYGAFLQDGLAAVKKGRVDIITKLVFNTLLLKPEWFNIDKILKIESEYDLHSTFFWIVNKGRVSQTLTNADYDIGSEKLQNTLQHIEDKGSSLGLHKSVSDESFEEEIKKLGRNVLINRNHYLKFDLPSHFEKLEASPLKIDCSLGFAEHHGFRNSLGIPFVPYNFTRNTPYHFLEVPLNIMDGTFQKYMQLAPKEASRRIIEFIEKNKHNSVLSVLWHNHFFSSYRFRGFFEPYKELLIYLKEQNLNYINPEQLYQKYYHDDKVS